MWFASTPTLGAGSAVDVFDSSAQASVRDLGENLKRPIQHDEDGVEGLNSFLSVWLNRIMRASMI